MICIEPSAQAKLELKNMQAAMSRTKADEYYNLMVGDAHHHLTQIEEYRKKRREEWNDEFSKHLLRVRQAFCCCPSIVLVT